LKLEHGKHGGLAFALRPPASSATTRPPLLCFLHGLDEGPPTALVTGVTAHGPLQRGAAKRAGEFVVVAPQLPVRGDYWHRHVTAVGDLVMQTCDRFEADPAHLYLTGFSFGGNGVFDIAAAAGMHWAALWAVDPTRAPRDRLTAPVWLSVGEVSRAGLPRFVGALQLERIARGNPGPRVYVDEGDDHVGAARAYGDDRIYKWLLRWRSNAMA
jgi:poly(3-hydroxybutyrate) depolymerase